LHLNIAASRILTLTDSADSIFRIILENLVIAAALRAGNPLRIPADRHEHRFDEPKMFTELLPRVSGRTVEIEAK
jgi:hypothetical protein